MNISTLRRLARLDALTAELERFVAEQDGGAGHRSVKS
jgi:hypothetical protein